MDKKNFAFDKTNFILLAAGMVVIIIGFLLMTGPGSTEITSSLIFSVYVVSSSTAGLLPGIYFHDLRYTAQTEKYSKQQQ